MKLNRDENYGINDPWVTSNEQVYDAIEAKKKQACKTYARLPLLRQRHCTTCNRRTWYHFDVRPVLNGVRVCTECKTETYRRNEAIQ